VWPNSLRCRRRSPTPRTAPWGVFAPPTSRWPTCWRDGGRSGNAPPTFNYLPTAASPATWPPPDRRTGPSPALDSPLGGMDTHRHAPPAHRTRRCRHNCRNGRTGRPTDRRDR
jgi:hypothetical protein